MMQMPQVRKVYGDSPRLMINKPQLVRKGLIRPVFV